MNSALGDTRKRVPGRAPRNSFRRLTGLIAAAGPKFTLHLQPRTPFVLR